MDCQHCQKPLKQSTSSLNSSGPHSSNHCPSCLSILGRAESVDSKTDASRLAQNRNAFSGPREGIAAQPTVSRHLEEDDGDFLKALRAQLANASVPWLHRKDIGYCNAFIRTTELVLSKPRVAFANCHGGFETWLDTASYYVASTFIPFAAFFYIGCCADGFSAEFALYFGVVFAIAVPILVFWLYIHTAIAHLFYGIVSAETGSFDATKQVICFAYGAVQLPCQIMVIWQLVYNSACHAFGMHRLLLWPPFIGQVVYCIWLPVCLVVGFKHAHGTSYAKSATAVLLPALVPIGVNVVAHLLLFRPVYN